MSRAPQTVLRRARLHVLITEARCAGDWLEVASRALRGGAGVLQLREKHLPDRLLLERALRLRELCDRRGALCIVNDRPDIAVAAGAGGVHLGQDDLPVAAARRIMGRGRIVGLSTHTVDQARAALRDPPDYIAVGPMFPSATKDAGPIAGPATLRRVRQVVVDLPLVAVGGIDAGNAGALGDADAVAACGAVTGVREACQAARALGAAFQRARPPDRRPDATA